MVPRSVRALASRNYRLFFVGQGISLTGLWMQRVAMSWLVYRLTGSSLALGTVDFVGQIPSLFLGFFVGVLLDRWDLRRVIFLCQAFCMLHALTLAALTLSGAVVYWHVVLMSALLGVVNAFELPARLSFVVHMVDNEDDVGNAIALNSSLFNVARLVGPASAGIIIALIGEGLCFLLNGLSYLATLLALFLMRLRPREAPPERDSLMAGIKSGWTHAFGWAPNRALLLAIASLSFFGLPYLTLLPLFAGDILKGGPHTLGFLTTVMGIGALTSSITLALRKGPVGLGRIFGLSILGFGGSLAAFALSRNLYLSMLCIVPLGYCMVAAFVACNTLLQALVEDSKRNRVMSIYNLAIMGVAPLGSLTAGWIATFVGAPLTLAAGGVSCFITGLLFLKALPALATQAAPVLRERGYLSSE